MVKHLIPINHRTEAFCVSLLSLPFPIILTAEVTANTPILTASGASAGAAVAAAAGKSQSCAGEGTA